MLRCAGLSGLTELNGLAWSPERSTVVLADLNRVIRREPVKHVDLRCLASTLAWAVC
jgi:hypothetical protein